MNSRFASSSSAARCQDALQFIRVELLYRLHTSRTVFILQVELNVAFVQRRLQVEAAVLNILKELISVSLSLRQLIKCDATGRPPTHTGVFRVVDVTVSLYAELQATGHVAVVVGAEGLERHIIRGLLPRLMPGSAVVAFTQDRGSTHYYDYNTSFQTKDTPRWDQ